jgi:hypothetical protein
MTITAVRCHFEERSDEKSYTGLDRLSRFRLYVVSADRSVEMAESVVRCHFEERSDEKSYTGFDKTSRFA